jgi:uncharacterized iron-regulated protein
MKKFITFTFLLYISLSFSQEKAFVIYNSKGKKVSFAALEKVALQKEFVFFGELHNDPIAHWLQGELFKKLYKKHGNALVAGSEMFEQDNQAQVNAYLAGKLTEKQFKDSCRLWTNFETDYKPMLDFAKMNQIPWIATNIPRRYASLVFKKGVNALDTLSDLQKSWMCPLPFPVDTTLSQYAALTDSEMHMGPNFVRAQAIKDATMAHFILKNFSPGKVMYHLNGSYHSDFNQSILWYLNYYGKIDYSRMMTISTVSQTDISTLEKEYLGKADFIICVPEGMTKTH